jgi:hypothetical protein
MAESFAADAGSGPRFGLSLRIALLLMVSSTALIGCGGPSSLRGQMDQAEKVSGKAEADLEEAERAIRKLEVARAEESLKSARDRLADPNISKYPEHQILKDRLKRDEEQLVGARAELKKQELERAVLAQRQAVEKSWARAEKAVELVRPEDGKAGEIDDARDALKDVRAKLEDGVELEKQDAKLAEYSASIRKKLTVTTAALKRAEVTFAFRDGPLASRNKAAALAERASSERDDDKQKSLRTDAIEKYRSCASVGAQMIATTTELGKTKLQLDGKTVAAEAIATDCAKKADSLSKLAKKKAAAAALATAKKNKKAKKK